MNTLENPATLEIEPITRIELIKYAGASGDFNPIHLIDEEAKNTGLPGIIAHGMLNMAKVARVFSTYLEKGYIKKFSTRFSGMVFLGDELKIIPQFKSRDGHDYYYTIEVKNQENKLVLRSELILSLLE